MAEKDFKRRLTAILSADVEGYSRLMREDEAATVHTITAYRTAMTHIIEQYRGRVVDAPGDNILAEFTSVVDAVNCGVEIQRDLAERNAELPENRRMLFRIGINLGDVLEEGKRIYGDGVNIAARMESLAEAGEICISGTVYDAIENKIGLEYESLGEHEVKNIDKPVRAYRVLSYPGAAAHRVVKARVALKKKWRNAALGIAAVLVIGAALAIWYFNFRPPPIEAASVEKMAFPLPDKPSIAVLPFVNMSEDPKQEYIADGISENLIIALSYISQFFVIARNSTFTYKGKAVKIKQVSEDLGVRYVVEGSIQKEGDRIRIIAQLIDALKGHHIWSAKYDRQMEDLFDLIDDIVLNIASALHVEIAEDLTDYKCTENLEAWEILMKGRKLFDHLTKEDNIKSRELFEQGLEIDPNCLCCIVMLTWTHLIDFMYGWTESRDDSFKLGVELANKALSLYPEKSSVQATKAAIYRFQRQLDKAIIQQKKAIAIEPNSSNYYMLGIFLHLSGNPEEGIENILKAMRLNPYYNMRQLYNLIQCYRMAGRYEEAIDANKRLLERSQKGEFNLLWPHLFFAEIYTEIGQEDKARSHAKEVLKINPKFSVNDWGKSNFYKNPADLERRLKALRKAGLPE